ncbi:dihydropteroate synthase [Kribbella sp.]|uniref:dihydropteroate synthase n=1 Tax=Kribbella sp. TaxID=1871183 RepID=UPI002D331622|nr:dihydropteroate synthase [Kribbella sp.]HZX06646.1 dihydropteroate synthase [Kribbella sp.]
MARPTLVGIVNITRDSFSDGGRYLAPPDAIARARELSAAGADLVELGPASSHPDAETVPPREEIERLAGVIDGLGGIPWGVDSYHPETHRYAAARGASYLNDIQGFPDPRRYGELAGLSCRLVVMHSVQRFGPATRVLTDPRSTWERVEAFFDQRIAALDAAGIARDRLILDPGLGYFLGSTPAPSLAVLGNLSRLKERYGLPVLVSPSRKSFLRAITGTGLSAIGPATLAAELHAAGQGADYLRTHDPAALSDALSVQRALSEVMDRPPDRWGPGAGLYSAT